MFLVTLHGQKAEDTPLNTSFAFIQLVNFLSFETFQRQLYVVFLKSESNNCNTATKWQAMQCPRLGGACLRAEPRLQLRMTHFGMDWNGDCEPDLLICVGQLITLGVLVFLIYI